MAQGRSANSMTLMRTHNMANIGAVAVIVGGIMNQLLLMTTIAQLAAILTDRIIDRFGHAPSEKWSRIMKRTPTTHSIITAPVWAIATGLLISWIAGILTQSAAWFSSPTMPRLLLLPPTNLTTPIVTACVAAATIHLILDSLTEAGIYMPHMPNPRNSHLFIRWKLAGLRYDNPELNISVSLIGLLAYLGYLLYGNPHLAILAAGK